MHSGLRVCDGADWPARPRRGLRQLRLAAECAATPPPHRDGEHPSPRVVFPCAELSGPVVSGWIFRGWRGGRLRVPRGSALVIVIEAIDHARRVAVVQGYGGVRV